MIFAYALALFALSQLYWAWRGYRFAAARIRSRAVLAAVCAVVLAVYCIFVYFNLGPGRARQSPVHLTARNALLEAPFLWWMGASFFASILVLLLAGPRAIARRIRKSDLASPARREILASAVISTPFVAGAYGLLYGRLNLETTEPVIRLPRLPRAFDGFRICQLSDIHIGPFMPAEEIRRYAAMANEQKADMIVLTGDFVTFDGTTQYAVVDALRGLHAPYGVWGCLGNHDAWCVVEDSITELFRQTGVRMLRGANVPIVAGAESFNLIGVDFQSARRFGPSPAVPRLLGDIEHLVDPHRVNILLSHNPDTYDRAAELGIDFSLAGHTHGGQLALEFISPEIAPSRIVTPYVAGWFGKAGGQLYVNRGIGTIFLPMRVGAPPEMTVYKLARA